MATNPIVPGSGGSTSQTNGSSPQDLNSMFLQLLIAQLQNQDPTNPVDPTQFVTQLAQFSELGEVSSIYTLLQQVTGTSSTGSSSSGSGSGSGSGTGGASNNISSPANAIPAVAGVSAPRSPILSSAISAAPAFARLATQNANSSPAPVLPQNSPLNFSVPASIPQPKIEGVF
jgi:hypothetical protein